jgi:hypothetical protein
MRFDEDASAEERYRAAPFSRLPVDSANVLAQFPGLGTRLLSLAEANSLHRWSEFRTLDEQAQLLSNPTSFISREDAVNWLQGLHSAGLLIGKRDFLARCRQFRQWSGGKISWLAIPTRDRNRELSRLLKSLARYRKERGNALRLLISDGTESSSGASNTVAAIRKSINETHGEVYYVGPKQKQRFVTALVEQSGAPVNVVSAALLGMPGSHVNTGAVRNCILVQTAGEMVFCVDDDTRAEPYEVRGDPGMGGVEVAGHTDPCEIVCFDSRAEALSFASRTSIDVLSAHERFLGARVATVVARQEAERADLLIDRLCPHLLAAVDRGIGVIRSTFNGMAGDSGLYTDFRIIASNNAINRRRIQEESPDYARLIATREVICRAPRTTICHADTVGPGMFWGMDNREILPPFLPGFRNQDGLFSMVLARCADDTYVAHLPFVLPHDPEGTRQYADERSLVRFPEVLGTIVSQWHPAPSCKGIVQRLESLGTYLLGLGRLSELDFSEYLQEAACTYVTNISRSLENLLRTQGYSPEWWLILMERKLERIRASLAADPCIGFSDLRVTPDQRPVVLAQQAVESFGSLLSWWPSLIRGVRELASEDIMLAERIG